MGRFSVCLLFVTLLLDITGSAAAVDSKDKRAAEAELGKLRGQITLLIKQLPANYRYAARDAEGDVPPAVTELRALNNPRRADAIAALLPRERRADIRALFVELLAEDRERARGMLVKLGIADSERMVRNLARATWDELDPVDIVAMSNHYVSQEQLLYPALDALNDSGVLDRLPAEPPLRLAAVIDSLIKRLYRADKSLVGVDSVQAAQSGNASRRVQRRDAAVVVKRVPDPVVHSVLTRITKADFEYDLEQWDRWYAIKFR